MNTKNQKKLISFAFEYFSKEKAISQAMYVKNNPYDQANKQYVFVKKDSDLDATYSNLYIANDGQLLQVATGFEANYGASTLSFIQQGINNYHYNYCSSPVGNGAKLIS